MRDHVMRKRPVAAAGFLLAVSIVLGGCGGQEGSGEAAVQDTVEEAEQKEETKINQGENVAEGTGQGAEAEAPAESGEQGADAAGQESVSLAGTSLSVFGDSISSFQGYNPAGYSAFFPENGAVKEVEDTWWQIVAEDLDLELYTNGSSSGATVTGDSTGMEDPQCACNEFRTNDLAGPGGVCPDRIVVYLGTNDMLRAVPLGENDGTSLVIAGEVEAFSDAYTLMIDKLQANYPLAQIYCCTLLQVGDYGTETPYVEFVNGAGLTAADYSDVIVTIAENRELPVIDLYHCGIAVENLQEMTSDGVHPTEEGMRRIAEAVKEAFVE